MPDSTHIIPADPVRRRRRPSGRAVALGGAAAVAIALGGGAAAVAATSSTPSTSPSTTGTATAPPGGPRAGMLANHEPDLDGKVKSVSGTTILITDHDGFTRTIVTSGTTEYTDGLTASPAVGTQIHAEGKVDANGTSLDASTVGKARTRPAGGPDGHGRGGPGGHGPGMGSRPTGTPPTGTPPTTATPKTTAPSVSPSPSAS